MSRLDEIRARNDAIWNSGMWATLGHAFDDCANGIFAHRDRAYLLALLDEIGKLPRFGLIGGRELRVLHGSKVKSAISGEKSELYIRADELTEILQRDES
jgi:hypothetical protein